ncbi:hypothetical protein FJT64_026948 [Amphibalanus amphitrite]|uniref:Uncharacterized protein n=1 Tax=Amphibalanus amphitrite TaxID=1232801 RepID=A0A6A4WEW3_AMPAM|nr:hypothetical protein FJT64_026948 [Amphibalanus amphitrite]
MGIISAVTGRLKWLWAALPAVRCRLPDSPPGPGCWPPVLPAAQCPSSVRCCGLEIRRDTRPGMVDASVPAAEVLGSPATAGRPSWRGTVLETAECRQYSRPRADSGPYSTRSAALDTPLTGDYIRHAAASGDYNCRATVSGEDDPQTSQFSDYSHHTSQSGDYNRHAAQTSDSSEHTADSSKYSQHRAVLDPTALL